MWAILLILTLSAGASAADFNSLIEQGRNSLVAFDLDAAQSALGEACPAEQVAAFPLPMIALCEHESGMLEEARGRIDEAGDLYRKALADWEKLGRQYLPHHVSALANLGGLYRRQHRLGDAEKMLGQALELAKAAAGSDPETYATVLIRSAGLYGELDQADRARAMLQEAISGLRALSKSNAPELAYAYS